MKRTTVMLPDDLEALLDLASRRRRLSAAEVIRQALAAYLRGEVTARSHVPFAALG